jgi:integrase/recombinase XerD
MNTSEQQRFDCLYQQHLTNLTLQGKRPATIDAYSRAVRRISACVNCIIDYLKKREVNCRHVGKGLPALHFLL